MKAIFDLLVFTMIISGLLTYLGMKFAEWLETSK